MERTLKASANIHPSSNFTKGENTVCVKGLKYFTVTHNPLETTKPQAQAHVGVSGKQSFFFLSPLTNKTLCDSWCIHVKKLDRR